MYICICHGITDTQLTEAIKGNSGKNTKDIIKSLGVGSDCGICLEDAIERAIATSICPSALKSTQNNS